MTAPALTIAQTIDEIRTALREYIEATYHIGHPSLIRQRQLLLDQVGNTYQVPFLESTPRYTPGKRFSELVLDPAVHQLFAALTSTEGGVKPLLFDPPYTHQATALEGIARDGRSLVVTTGTGSGKTETFLLPMLAKLAEEAANRPQSFSTPAVRALVLYPMNALVNDQLGRLRLLLGDHHVTKQFSEWAGRPARFARYTSRTLYPGVRTVDKDRRKLKSLEKYYIALIDEAANNGSPRQKRAQKLVAELKVRGKWPAKPDLKAWYGAPGKHWKNAQDEFQRAVLLPDDPELLTRHEVLDCPPDVLITNYSMLEYMLMRPLERPIFDATKQWLQDNPHERFLLIIDEAHLYRGAAGAEVALLMRRLRARLGIPASRLQVIATSASFSNAEPARAFAAQLTGKNTEDFDAVLGDLDYRKPAATGSAADAAILAGIPMNQYYQADNDPSRLEAVADLLQYRGIVADLGAKSSEVLHRALHDFPPLAKLVNDTMKEALPLSKLGKLVFPDADAEIADRAVSTLISLGSAARLTPQDAGLLPCRVHAFFRGLPGLWVCLDPDCTVERNGIAPGPTGAMYGQPRNTCDCGARVFELFTCRQCGTAYARAYTDNIDKPSYLWAEPGAAFNTSSGPVAELRPIDLLLEEPSADVGNAELRELDLVTGRLHPEVLGERWRRVWLRYPRHEEEVNEGADSKSKKAALPGEFVPCGVCGESANFGRTSVQDHLTKGDQPFQALVSRQLEVQPPGPQPADDFAPLRGRKVLAFSDSRQVAARLAPNVQDFSLRDAVRPIVLKGWHELSQQPAGPTLSLENLYLAAMVGAKLLGVRLRPELTGTENFEAFTQVSQSIDRGALTDIAEFWQLFAVQDPPPQSLLQSLVPTLTSQYYNFQALGLATLRERGNLKNAVLADLVDIPGVAVTQDEKLALLRLWLSLWSRPGIWFSAMNAEWKGNEVQSATGKFRKLDRWFPSPASRRIFEREWLPVLQSTFCQRAGDQYHLMARAVALELDGAWSYCGRCRFMQRPFPGRTQCIWCGAANVRPIDPDTDEVFQARKGYYRSSATRALTTPPGEVLNIVAAEHTAQLNSSRGDDAFSKAEMYELLFQDVDIAVPAPGAQPDVAVDLLSCTTTMEVGIDIGSLSGVALRNMPPSRANYQQRAGRAGRRGNAVATVVSFGSADTHDDHYFREPEEMISGEVIDPILTLNNVEIAKRHLTAFLLQRYHQDRVRTFDPATMPANLFEVLGSVTDFLSDSTTINRTDFEKWLVSNEAALRAEVDDWLPSEIAEQSRDAVLDSLVKTTLKSIDTALDAESGDGGSGQKGDGAPGDGGTEAKTGDGSDAEDAEAAEGDEESGEDGREELSAQRARVKLLDRLLYKGALPRYAFPTDVVSFHIFDQDRSTLYRPVFEYAPSQGLSVALSQYAPGKVVWVDKREWTSGALYSPMGRELREAWDVKRIYFECQDCHYAEHKEWEQADIGRMGFCPACDGERFGPGMNWMRPPGFAHRTNEPPGTSPDDQPAISYATRAKLIAGGPDGTDLWQGVTDRIQQNFGRRKLLVSNTGPDDEGYTYCVACGLVEPTAMATPLLAGTHHKPFPSAPQDPMCQGGYTTRRLVLGTDFISDVLLIRMTVANPVTLRPSFLSSQIALRTVAEALTIAATTRLEIETNELQAEFRPALTPHGGSGREAEIYLYDTLAGGAGFTQQVNELGREIFELALNQLENCPADCEESCYRCLRSFRNRFEHTQMDRHVGASLLRYLLDGTLPELDPERLDRSAQKLYEDLERSGVEGARFERNAVVDVAGIGSVDVPILATNDRGTRIFVGVHGPLTPDVAPAAELQRVAQETFERVRLIDDLIIARSLPNASRQILDLVR
ncbi:DEAD/DEAH box helicase [Mycobacteroides chelonae]|nr:Zn-binding domain-containing protein [Mycobacteroides chelonae]